MQSNTELPLGEPMAFVFKTNVPLSEVLHMEQMLLTMEHMARERAGKAASLNQVF
jgi:hypothetical protein